MTPVWRTVRVYKVIGNAARVAFSHRGSPPQVEPLLGGISLLPSLLSLQILEIGATHHVLSRRSVFSLCEITNVFLQSATCQRYPSLEILLQFDIK